MKIEFSQEIKKKKNITIQFYENPFGGSCAVPCGWTDMMKLIFPFGNVVSKNSYCRKTCKPTRYVVCCRHDKRRDSVYNHQERYAAACVKGHTETYHTRKNYGANVHFIHIEQ
jgi:hypothetical protein